MNKEIPIPVVGVQQQVIEKFIIKLQEDKVSLSVIDRLKNTISSGPMSEKAIKNALLPDESSI